MFPSLSGDDSKLYFTIEIADGERKKAPTLYTIDPAILKVTSRALKVPGRVIGSGLVNGAIYLFSAEGHIIRLNTATGETTVVSSYDSSITDDGPPLTGVFSVVGALEPSKTVDTPA